MMILIKSESKNPFDSIMEELCRLLVSGSSSPFCFRIIEQTGRQSLIKAVNDEYKKEYAYLRGSVKKKIEREFNYILQTLELESYKDGLKMSPGKTSKYQFSKRDFSYLKSLENGEKHSEEDMISDAIEVFGCFYRAENMDIDRLNEIGERIFSKICNFDVEEYMAVLEQKTGDMDEISGCLIKSIFLNYARKDERFVGKVEKML